MNKLILYFSIIILFFLTGCTTQTTVSTKVYQTITTQTNNNSKLDFYRLFDNSIKHEIVIEMTQEEWNHMIQDMKNYHNQFGSYKSDTYFKANMIYKDQYGMIEINEVGFRTKGNTTRILPQLDDGTFTLSNYKIKFDETFNYPVDSEDYMRLKKRKVFDLEELNLKTNRNYDSTYMSEIYSFYLFNEIGVHAPYATLSTLTLKIGNEETLLGVYSIFEPIDENFIKRRYAQDETGGNLYKCLWQDHGPATLITGYHEKAIGIKDVSINYRPTYDLKTNKRNADFKDLKWFINDLNRLNGDAFEKFIEDNFEVDQFIKLLALGVLLGNPDDYRGLGNNYYLYYNPKTDKFSMIPYDYDHSLGQGWGGEPAFTNYSIGADIYNWPNNNLIWNQPYGNGAHPLADKILSNEKYQIKYEQYLREYVTRNNNIFNYTPFKQQYDLFKDLYNEDAINSLQNFSFGERNARWYFNEKVKDINNQLNYYQNNR